MTKDLRNNQSRKSPFPEQVEQGGDAEQEAANIENQPDDVVDADHTAKVGGGI